MDKGIKEKWVKALRSGRYKQIREYLKTDEGYCCLGVLCNIINRRKWKETIFGECGYQDGATLETYELPIDVRKQAKLHPNTVSKLIEMNDGEGKSFNQIADYIEKKL